MNRPTTLTAHLAWLSALALTACGSGSDEAAEPPPAATVLSGVVAVGSPLASASVTISDVDGATADVTTTAASNGTYSADVSTLKAPLLVKATGTHEGAPTTQWAVVPAVTASATNTANVTPLTTAVAALVAPAGEPQALATIATLAANGTTAKVGDATTLLVNTLKTDPQTSTALGATFNPLTTTFTANGEGIDAVLDRIQVEVSSAGVTLTNQAAAVGNSGVPAGVILTAAMTATPTTAPALPPTAASTDLPSAADLAGLAKKFDDCMALPLASRVTMDADGNATAVSATCDFAPANFRSNGNNWVQEVGQWTLSKSQLNGAKLKDGRIVLALAPEGETDPKVHKHPYCNDNPCVVARWALTTPSNRAVAADWLLAKVNGQWNFVGNQRPYRAFVEPRLLRKVNTNRNGAAAGSNIDPYFLKDRFESHLRLRFDMGNTAADTNDVRAVRYTGPGLPAAGVVLVRSQRCGTDDRLAISNQAGTTFVYGTNTLQFWTSGAAVDFTLDAANLDGTALATPVPVNSGTTASFQDFSPTAVANQSATIPAWSRYKIEVFRFSSASNTPDEVFHVRINAAAENAAAGATKSWPALDPAFVSSYLVPNAANSGSFSDVARTMAWTNPTNGHVLDSYLFGQNFATQTNAQGESAFYGLRTRLDFEPAAWGDSNGAGWRFANLDSGTSLSTFTQTIGSNPNPRCGGTPGLVALTDNVNDYREAGLSFRGVDRKLYSAVWFWDN